MLLSAQRVRSPQGLVGVNTYVYRHAAGRWSSDLARLEADAELVAQQFEIPPGGNDVRSYLDVFAPEETPIAEIAQAATRIRSGADPASFPTVFHDGDLSLRFGLVAGLVPSWHTEWTDLISRLLLSVASGR
jgi:hypothetical protein